MVVENKFLLIGKEYGIEKRGSYYIYKNFCQRYPNNLTFIKDTSVKNLKELNFKYNKLIFCNHALHNYTFPINFYTLKNINHICFTREFKTANLFNSATNGFSIYKKYNTVKYFIPTILSSYTINNTNTPINITYGFYSRPDCVGDSLIYLYDYIKTQKIFNLVTCGVRYDKFKSIPQLNWTHTTNREEFFNSITHYIYPKSGNFIDPFPHTLLEAIQCGKQIISPKLNSRIHFDGVDDILQMIKYHNKISSTTLYDNTNTILDFQKFNKFYINLINNDFIYNFDRNKYKTFYDWCSGEL